MKEFAKQLLLGMVLGVYITVIGVICLGDRGLGFFVFPPIALALASSQPLVAARRMARKIKAQSRPKVF